MSDRPEPEHPRGIVENVGSVTNALIRSQPPGFMAMLVFCFGIMGLFAWSNHDTQLERIRGIVTIFDSCTQVMKRIPQLLPPDARGSFNWDAAPISVAQV